MSPPVARVNFTLAYLDVSLCLKDLNCSAVLVAPGLRTQKLFHGGIQQPPMSVECDKSALRNRSIQGERTITSVGADVVAVLRHM